MPRGRPRKNPEASAAPSPRRRQAAPKPLPLAYRLVLNQWLLGLFNVKRFEDLAALLKDEALEGLDENNVHRFHHALTAQLFNLTQLPTELLLEYDQNIVRHTQRLSERRLRRGEEPLRWKYFQYLALLFTEIYLDRWFRDGAGLLRELNAQIAAFNEGKPEGDQIKSLEEGRESALQLNKLAFWMATGSGKTLLMHANILQYRHYLAQHGKARDLNRIILLTPNEGLSQQHLREFALSGIEAEIFSKDARGLFAGQAVEILEVTRLRDDMGEKTVAVDAFEGNNLVLVDEGHRGASGGGDGAWMRYRDALCEKGFSFEYSATFGQAVKGSPGLSDRYAKCILFDYSYRFFYADGFGKDYQILNLDEATERLQLDLYLTACLLSFYQQLRLFQKEESAFKPFGIEKPLWIFVGGSVTASLGTKEGSDIIQILRFLAEYVKNRADSVDRIRRVLNQGLVTASGRNVFDGRFTYLTLCGLTPEQVFDETLALLFNAPAGGQLYVENLKGATGEVALRIGAENDPFGVINVGDDAKLVKLCEQHGLETGEREFTGSLFQEINKSHSTVNVLIGSRKFTEGWSSWRVATMGLMNVGRGEGAQIIQLFGRGVRLRGFGMSLKRSSSAPLPAGLERPNHISTLETLGIFGIKADYMAQFRDFLEEEGLPTNDDRIEFILPIVKNLGTQKLKTIRLKRTINGVTTEFGDAFRKLAPIPTLARPNPADRIEAKALQQSQVVLNWYPKIQAMRARGLSGGDGQAELNEAHLTPLHVAALDIDALFFELESFKAERGWHNFNLSRKVILDLLADTSWYRIQIPAEELSFRAFDRVRLWQEIAAALLRKYAERYYTFRKREWELPHLEIRDLDENDANFPHADDPSGENYYRILIDRSREDIAVKLDELKAEIEAGTLQNWEFQGIKAIGFDAHLYQPLLYCDSAVVEIKPIPLNRGERDFVEDLRTFSESQEGKDFFNGRRLYLLRNMSRGRGVGFFEAGNFYPDFILWLLEGGRQRILFIDPKGIRNLGKTDPKIEFYQTIKEIEQRLAYATVTLDSFIISNTPAATMQMLWSVSKEEMEDRHILFQIDDRSTYVGKMLGMVPAATGSPAS
jgi:hypothetical protein